jgi:ribulose-5-phosphate 4-epimerase/fuculose-1-phosphate aldolase
MSRLFEVLTRLETRPRQGTTELPPAPLRSDPAPRITPLVARTFSNEPFHTPMTESDPPAVSLSNRLLALAFDASMVVLALGLFVGVCFVSGNESVFILAKSVPWLILMLAGLALLYWVLSAILGRDAAGPGDMSSNLSETYHWPWDDEQIDPRDEQDVALVRRDEPRGVALVRRPLIEDLALAHRILANEGVLDAFGSVSVRDDSNPNRIFLAGPDIHEYDLNGKPSAGDPFGGHPERFLHCEIYRARPDVMAIVHSRASELIPFASSTVALLPISQVAAFLSPGVPVFESRQVGEVSDPLIRARALGHALAETLGDRTAALIRNRGAVVVGPSLHAAVGRAYYMNMNARMQVQTILLGGKVNYLESGEPPATAASSEFDTAWEFWKQKISM